MSQKKDFERTYREFRNLISQLSEQPKQSSLIRSLLQPRPRSRLHSSSRSQSQSRQTINIEQTFESIDRKLDDLMVKVAELKELYDRQSTFSTKDKDFVNVIKVFKIFYYKFIIYLSVH